VKLVGIIAGKVGIIPSLVGKNLNYLFWGKIFFNYLFLVKTSRQTTIYFDFFTSFSPPILGLVLLLSVLTTVFANFSTIFPVLSTVPSYLSTISTKLSTFDKQFTIHPPIFVENFPIYKKNFPLYYKSE
jgi:hypothetical protein